MSVHAYLGPTLAPDEARGLAGLAGVELEVHPPARCGDLLRLLRDETQTPDVLLVDGIYERVPALWHKEIIAVLAAGGRVIGCSSMGALRAAECVDWGAQPSGRIAEEYATGIRTSDADVAVAHADASEGYRALSVPLVDVEAAIEQARQHEIVNPVQAERLLVSARSTFYASRSWPRLLTTLDPRTANRLREEVLSLPGRKELDARQTIERLRDLLDEPVNPSRDPLDVLPTQQLETIRAELDHSQNPELLAGLEESEEWPELMRAGLIRALIAGCRIAGIAQPSTAEATEALAQQLRLPSREAVARLAQAWETTPAHVVQLGREQLQLTQLWSCYGQQARAHVVDHLRIVGRFSEVNECQNPQ